MNSNITLIEVKEERRLIWFWCLKSIRNNKTPKLYLIGTPSAGVERGYQGNSGLIEWEEKWSTKASQKKMHRKEKGYLMYCNTVLNINNNNNDNDNIIIIIIIIK